MRATKLGCLLAAMAVTVALAGCAETTGSANSDALTQQLCTESDLGGNYLEKTSGTFSIQNLADLSDNSSARAKQLKAAGLEGGRFAYWIHTVPNPPFNPPLEVICQAMAFGSAKEANAFVNNLKPTPDDLASTAMTWLPKHRTVQTIQEVAPGLGQGYNPDGPGQPPPRTFQIKASDANVDYTIYVQVSAAGSDVRTVYIGKSGEANSLNVNAAGEIAVAIDQRLQKDASP